MKGSKLTRAIFKSGKRLKRASPMALTVLSAVGVISTTVLAVKAAPKAAILLEKKEREKRGKLSKLETVCTVVPVYIPTVLTCTTTIVCIFGINALNKRQQASIASAYALLNQSYKKYRDAAKVVYGEDANDKIVAEIAKKVYVSGQTFVVDTNLYDPSKGVPEEEILFYDSFGERYFTSTLAAVINAEYHVNRNLALRGYVYLKELYDFLGLTHTDGDDIIGWNMDDSLANFDSVWIDFENRAADIGDGTECLIMDSIMKPSLIEL